MWLLLEIDFEGDYAWRILKTPTSALLVRDAKN